jgi:WD40 repeat protein
VATTGIDGLVQLWDARTWRKVGTAFQVAAGFGASVSFDPTGRFLVTGSGGDDTVKLFDISRPGRAIPFGAPSFPTTQDPEAWVSAQFTGDGSAIVVVESNGEAWVWPLRWQDWAAHACAAAGRQLSRAEWSQFVPGRPYANVCPSSSEVGPGRQ